MLEKCLRTRQESMQKSSKDLVKKYKGKVAGNNANIKVRKKSTRN